MGMLGMERQKRNAVAILELRGIDVCVAIAHVPTGRLTT